MPRQEQDNQISTMISVPVGGPGEGQQFVPCFAHGHPPTSDAESGTCSVSTVTQGATTLGEAEPDGFHRSDTEPPTDLSVERERPEDTKADQPTKEEDSQGQEEPNPENPNPETPNPENTKPETPNPPVDLS